MQVLLITALLCINYSCYAQETSPTYADFIQQGKRCAQQNNLSGAYTSFSLALEHCPADFEITREIANCFLHVGNEYFARNMNEEALKTFKTILTISDQFSAVHHNIAFTLAERMGDHAQAIKHYQRALELNPNNIETHFCASLSYLATGDLLQGFKEYEYRWQRLEGQPRTFIEPLKNLWDGQADLHGKTVLIRTEQGLGDTLHFIRYAEILKEQGAFIIVETQKPLLKLLSLCPYIDHVMTIGTTVPPFDYQIPLLSLPHACKTTLETIPAKIPYLHADGHLEKIWAEQLSKEQRVKIGICWQGDTAHGAGKFMPLRTFSPLLNHPDVCVYSLQQINGLDQITSLQNDNLHLFNDDFDKTHGNFMDTAAVIKNLDLVITVDTSTAHLAAGLGVPVWLILPFPAEWRWLSNRCDSPWYPTMVLFRQQKHDEWEPVIHDIMTTLEALLDFRKKNT